MDLSCEEKLQNSGNHTALGKPVDMCIAGPDPALDRDPRVLINLIILERAHALHTNYFKNVQIDVQPFMRKVVTTWMLEVCEEQQCEEQVFPLAVSYMDRFLAKTPISRQQLQLLAVTAMLIASKFRQCHPLSIDLLCAYTDNSVLPSEVRLWEVLVMQELQWKLSIATAFDYIAPMLARSSWGKQNPLVRSHAITLTSVCYIDEDLFILPPSLIAQACIIAAARGLNVNLSVAELCALTASPPAAAEVVAQHVEDILCKETSSQRQVTPIKQPTSPTTHIPTTPTDVQDVHY